MMTSACCTNAVQRLLEGFGTSQPVWRRSSARSEIDKWSLPPRRVSSGKEVVQCYLTVLAEVETLKGYRRAAPAASTEVRPGHELSRKS